MNIYEELDGLLLQILPDVYRTVKVVPTGSKRPGQFIVWRETMVDSEMSSNSVYAYEHTFSVSVFTKTAPDDVADRVVDLLTKNQFVQSDQRDVDYDETTGYYGKYLAFYKIRAKEN